MALPLTTVTISPTVQAVITARKSAGVRRIVARDISLNAITAFVTLLVGKIIIGLNVGTKQDTERPASKRISQIIIRA